MGKLYKNIGGPHWRRAQRGKDGKKVLGKSGRLITQGEVFEPTAGELRAFPEKFVPVGGTSARVSKPEPRKEKAGTPAAKKEAEESQKASQEIDLSQYGGKGGYYEIPGVEGKVRGKEAALKALAELGETDEGSDSSEAEGKDDEDGSQD